MTSVGFNQLYKFVVVGDSAVGKTSLLSRFTVDEFQDNLRSTVGVDVRVKMVQAFGKEYKLALWDTAGQERFRTLTSAYYRGTHGIILVYDVTQRESFEHITSWLDEINKFNTNSNVAMMLVGNKVDLASERVVSTEEAADWARRNHMMFIEASAKTTVGVHEAFSMVLENIVYQEQHSPQEQSQPTQSRGIELNKSHNEDGGGYCC